MRGRAVLEHCTATIPGSTVSHLAGANGTGKSTLIRVIAGIQRHSGSIRFDTEPDVARVRSRMYVCFDDAAVFPYLSGYENVQLLIGRRIPRSVLAGIAPAIADDRLLRRRARALSHGERKRVHLVASFASGARYLLFDEALNGLDAATVAAFDIALRTLAGQSTVLLTGHDESAYDSIVAHRLQLLDGHIVSPATGSGSDRPGAHVDASLGSNPDAGSGPGSGSGGTAVASAAS
jgi:ABC-type multidrug transport system ATPase subunit